MLDENDTDAGLRMAAREALEAFSAISEAASAGLKSRGLTLEALAVVNQATAETTARDMRERNDQRVTDFQKLRREPAIARLVIADEDDRRETLYISSGGTVDQAAVRLCSYMSPKGQLAALRIGDFRDIRLPGGTRSFEVLEKLTFKPVDAVGGWDSQPAVQFRSDLSPLTIKSLREFLIEDGVPPDDADAVEAWLAGDDETADDNISEGIKRDVLTAMQLRVAPILDAFQDRIFRLPIDSQIAVLGPPGTGKTTTLVRRLRQKVDLAYLDPETEQPLIETTKAGDLPHANSWLMFTPTELLRLYVKEAFGKEGVPVHDERLHTWDDFRRDIGRGDLRILRTSTSKGLVIRQDDALLLPGTLQNQTGWFDTLNEHQQAAFIAQLETEAGHLAGAKDVRAAVLGREIVSALARSKDKPLQLLGEIAALWERLREIANEQREQTQAWLREPLRDFARADSKFLPALTQFVSSLDADDPDDDDAEDGDEELDERPTLKGNRLVEDIFVRAMRARAMAQATGRTVPKTNRSGRLLEWVQSREVELPDLRELGGALVVQRAALRLGRAPADYLTKIPQRYRAFRRAVRQEGLWYADTKSGAQDAHPAEVDLVLLAMLRTARALQTDQRLSRLLEGRQPPVAEAIAALQRNQVLVDEATDFSPIQLAIMRALTKPGIDSFFLSGDFRQRLTRWGSRTEGDLTWAAPGLQVERINITYRQSRKLAEFARALTQLQSEEVDEQAPDDFDNVGLPPVLGLGLDTIEAKARWLADRVREIDNIGDGALPTIAVLVNEADVLEPLAAAMCKELEQLNVRAVACPKGMAVGQEGDIRVFEAEHIKGLEFEAVFFLDVDQLEAAQKDLFDRYIYVGATRAATYLGLTCTGPGLPTRIAEVAPLLASDWAD